jgi:hypothetical protein
VQQTMFERVMHRPVAEETKVYIRSSFAVHRDKEELYDIKFALSDGREQLKRWREMLGLSCTGHKFSK